MAFLFFDIKGNGQKRDKDFKQVEKFNPYHDRLGRFTTAGGASSFTYKPHGSNDHKNAITREMFRTAKDEIKVKGPADTGRFMDEYEKQHPGTREKAKEYTDVMSSVQNFQKDHPGVADGTYNAITGELDNPTSGICVTFHQNKTAQDPYGAYTPQDYAEMCAVTMQETGAKSVSIGYFGNAEVSFNTSDKQKAVQFCVEHNQHSIYDCETGATIRNPYYKKELNPIELG